MVHLRIGKGFRGGLSGVSPIIPVSSSYLLEDYSQAAVRQTKGSGPVDLWQIYSPHGQVQNGGFDAANNWFQSSVTTLGPGASNGVYIQFFPNGGPGYIWDNGNAPGFAQGYTIPFPSGGDFTKINRLRCRLRCNLTFPHYVPNYSPNIGTYCKSHVGEDPGAQGSHYYWHISAGSYANEWIYWFGNRTLQGTNFRDINHNFDDDPLWNDVENVHGGVNPIHFLDGLTRFYFDAQGNGGSVQANSTWTMADWYFEETDNSTEPIVLIDGSGDPSPRLSNLVASATVTYGPTLNGGSGGYELTWQGPKNLTCQYRVAYKTTSMKAIGGGQSGWDSGTWDGTTQNTSGDAYSGVLWRSPALPRGNYWFGIRPLDNGSVIPNPSGYFGEVWYAAVA